MKTHLKALAAWFAEWRNLRWSFLTGRLPDLPADRTIPNAEQELADQKPEDEGGSARPAKKPGMKLSGGGEPAHSMHLPGTPNPLRL